MHLRLVLSVSLATPHTKSSYSPQLWRYFAIFCDSGLPFLRSEAATRSPSWSRNQMVPFPPRNTPTACRSELSPWPWLVKHHVIWCSPTSLTSAPSTLLKGAWSHKTPLCPCMSRPFLHHGLFTCSPFLTGRLSPSIPISPCFTWEEACLWWKRHVLWQEVCPCCRRLHSWRASSLTGTFQTTQFISSFPILRLFPNHIVLFCTPQLSKSKTNFFVYLLLLLSSLIRAFI